MSLFDWKPLPVDTVLGAGVRHVWAARWDGNYARPSEQAVREMLRAKNVDTATYVSSVTAIADNEMIGLAKAEAAGVRARAIYETLVYDLGATQAVVYASDAHVPPVIGDLLAREQEHEDTVSDIVRVVTDALPILLLVGGALFLYWHLKKR